MERPFVAHRLAATNDVDGLRRLPVAQLNEIDQDGNYPANLAAAQGHLPALRFLMEQRFVNVNRAGSEGRTVLHDAARGGHAEMAHYLVSERRANTLVRDALGRLPVDLAREAGHELVAAFLDVHMADQQMDMQQQHLQQHLREQQAQIQLAQGQRQGQGQGQGRADERAGPAEVVALRPANGAVVVDFDDDNDDNDEEEEEEEEEDGNADGEEHEEADDDESPAENANGDGAGSSPAQLRLLHAGENVLLRRDNEWVQMAVVRIRDEGIEVGPVGAGPYFAPAEHVRFDSGRLRVPAANAPAAERSPFVFFGARNAPPAGFPALQMMQPLQQRLSQQPRIQPLPPPPPQQQQQPRAEQVGHPLPAGGFVPGFQLDALDTVNVWYVSSVLAVDNDRRRILLHYNGWGAQWDEWLPMDSNRLAPVNTRSHGRVGPQAPASQPVAQQRAGPSQVLNIVAQGSLSPRGASMVENLFQPAAQQQQQPAALLGNGLGGFHVGMLLDVRDTVGHFYEAQVIGMEPLRIHVHYLGWSARWDEWLSMDSDRLAPLGTRARGQRGPVNEQPQVFPAPSPPAASPPPADASSAHPSQQEQQRGSETSLERLVRIRKVRDELMTRLRRLASSAQVQRAESARPECKRVESHLASLGNEVRAVQTDTLASVDQINKKLTALSGHGPDQVSARHELRVSRSQKVRALAKKLSEFRLSALAAESSIRATFEELLAERVRSGHPFDQAVLSVPVVPAVERIRAAAEAVARGAEFARASSVGADLAQALTIREPEFDPANWVTERAGEAVGPDQVSLRLRDLDEALGAAQERLDELSSQVQSLETEVEAGLELEAMCEWFRLGAVATELVRVTTLHSTISQRDCEALEGGLAAAEHLEEAVAADDLRVREADLLDDIRVLDAQLQRKSLPAAGRAALEEQRAGAQSDMVRLRAERRELELPLQTPLLRRLMPELTAVLGVAPDLGDTAAASLSVHCSVADVFQPLEPLPGLPSPVGARESPPNVFLAVEQGTGVEWVVKRYEQAGGPRAFAALRRHAHALARLQHRYVQRLHFVRIDVATGDWFTQVHRQPQDLVAWIMEGGGQSADAIRQMGRKLLQGVAYLHSQGVAHGDLRPSHVLVTASGDPLLTGFERSVDSTLPSNRVGSMGSSLSFGWLSPGSSRSATPRLAPAPAPSSAPAAGDHQAGSGALLRLPAGAPVMALPSIDADEGRNPGNVVVSGPDAEGDEDDASFQQNAFPGFVAPEISEGTRGVPTFSSDMFSVGAILEFMSRVVVRRVPAQLSALVSSLVVEEPERRPTALVALSSEYFDVPGDSTATGSAAMDPRTEAVRQVIQRLRRDGPQVNMNVTRVMVNGNLEVPARETLQALRGLALRTQLRVTFSQEEGVDGGGLTHAMYQSVLSQILNPSMGLFETADPDDPTCEQVLPAPRAAPEMITAVGGMMLRCLLESVSLGSFWRLPAVVYRYILAGNEAAGRNVLESITPDEAALFLGQGAVRRLEQLKFMPDDRVRSLRLTFDGLIPGGQHVDVTAANVREYVRRYQLDRVVVCRLSGLEKLRQGFRSAESLEITTILDHLRVSGSILQQLLGGEQRAELGRALRENRITFTHFRPDSPLPGLLGDVLRGLSEEEARSFLVFACGTDTLPRDGVRFVFQPGASPNSLLVAHTCFRTIDVSTLDPAQCTVEAVRERVLRSVRESAGRFGVM